MTEDKSARGKRLLILASYGMEIVECGGTAMVHVDKGWEVHAAVALCRPENRGYVEEAAAHMGITVEFLDYKTGELSLSKEDRAPLVRAIRGFRPNSVVLYDTEHSWSDLDPERRILSMLFLEALSICGRDTFPELGGPHSVSSVFYMSPERPNCVVDITSAYRRKMEALAMLRYQMEGSGSDFMQRYGTAVFEALGVKDPGDDYGRGLFLLEQGEKGHCLHYGLGEPGSRPLVERFRRGGLFVLDDLE